MSNCEQAEAVIQRRQQAARLLEDVLDERLEARTAINCWPETGEEWERDPSLEIAYQALWHFEADEERHRTEMFYLDAQLELLRQMAVFLKTGQELPGYMRQQYSPERHLRFYYSRNLWLALKHGIRRQIYFWASAWNRAWRKI